MLNRSFELCLKTYGEKHMLTLRLYLNIGILYEDNRDFQKAYDYFVKWHETCQEVRRAFERSVLLTYSLTIRDRSDSNLCVLVAINQYRATLTVRRT